MRPLRKLATAYAFVAGPADSLDRRAAEDFRRLSGYLMGLALLWGVILAGLWDLTYRLTFPSLLNWIVPACVCAAASVLGPYRRASLALAGTVAAGPLRWARWPVWVALAALLAAQYHALGWKEPDWPGHVSGPWAWLWPKAMYRVLLLSPVWGAWSMLAVAQFHRAGPRTDPPARHLAANVTPLAAAACLVPPLAGTFVYLMHLHQPLRFAPPAAAVLAALGGGTALVRLRGRLCRPALLAVNLLGQLAFLVACVTVM